MVASAAVAAAADAVPSAAPAPVDWGAVLERQRQRDFSARPCPICLQDFGEDEQVLLSCSHVFHKACLRSFERFSGRRSCPVCRASHYQERSCGDGAALFRARCATTIQTAWRGARARRQYQQLLRSIPPSAAEPAKRQAFFLARFAEANDQLVSLVDQDRDELDALFDELDASVAQSRSMMQAAHAPLCLPPSAGEWLAARARALERAVSECPICMVELAPGRAQALLSCSHVFHASCAASFELFAHGAGALGCPVCRQPFHKRVLEHGLSDSSSGSEGWAEDAAEGAQ